MNNCTSIMSGSRLIGRLILILLTAAGGALTVFALDPEKAINQYGHDVWLRQNGLPANSVNVSLQTRDGYLWLGTGAGLFRFDGVRFVGVSTDPTDSNRRESILTLMESTDGTLWVGTAFSGLRTLKDGKIRAFGNADGFDEKNILALFQGSTGVVWVG